MLQKMARERYGLEINAGPFDTDSVPALVAEKFAETQGKGAAFHKAVMQAFWQQARAINDPHVLAELAENVGLDTKNFAAALEDPSYQNAVFEDIRLAQEYGLSGVPALIFADHYLVSGAQPYEMLKQVVERVQQEGN